MRDMERNNTNMLIFIINQVTNIRCHETHHLKRKIKGVIPYLLLVRIELIE